MITPEKRAEYKANRKARLGTSEGKAKQRDRVKRYNAKCRERVLRSRNLTPEQWAAFQHSTTIKGNHTPEERASLDRQDAKHPKQIEKQKKAEAYWAARFARGVAMRTEFDKKRLKANPPIRKIR
jgi:hypothetical protein